MNPRSKPPVFYADGRSILLEPGYRTGISGTGDGLTLRVGRRDERVDRWFQRHAARRLTVVPLVQGCRALSYPSRAAASAPAALAWLHRQAARWIPALIKHREAPQSAPLPALGLLDASETLSAKVLTHMNQALALDLAPGEPVMLLWHPWAIPPWQLRQHLSPRQPAVPTNFIAMIRHVAQERTGGGCSCTERHVLPDGRVVEHSFPMATGWRWLARRAQYREQFGAELPTWTQVLHPATRGSLVQLSLAMLRPLPDVSPLLEQQDCHGEDP